MNVARIALRIAALAGLASAIALTPAWVGASTCSPALVDAVQRGDESAILAALEQGASIGCTDESGSTLLHILVIQATGGDDEGPRAGPLCRLLVDRGLNPNALDANGKTPLMNACMLQRSEAVQGLLAAGADPNFAGPDSSSALEYALGSGSLDIVTTLLRGRANPNQRISGDGLPLINAVTMGNAELVEVLLRAGADPSRVSAMGTSALDHARSSGNTALLALLEKPVAPGHELISGEPAAATPAGPDPLQVLLGEAVREKQYAKVEGYIAKGADANAPDLRIAPVLTAVIGGDLVAVDILLKHHATLNVSSPDGDTPLIHAIAQEDETLLRALMSRGADLNYVSSQGATALMAACQAGNLKYVRVLLDAGADPNVKGYVGMTALFWAAKENYTDIVRELVKHRADPNVIEEQFGATALVMALSSGHIESVKALVEAGADPTIVMKGQYAGMNAIDVARQIGAPDLVKLLEKAKPKH